MGNFNGNVSGSAVESSMNSQATDARKKSDFDVKNYLNTKLEKGEDERNITIRILPVSNEDGNFRLAIKTHNLKVNKRIAKSGFKSFLCLNDPQVSDYSPNVHCPICEKAKYYIKEAGKYYDTDNAKSKALYRKGCSLQAKTTYIVRVIERGKESDGVKFWRFNENTQGKGIYDALISLYKQRKSEMEEEGIENYNIFDLDNGRDIVLNLKRTKRADGQEGVAIQINDKSVNKPLTNDIELGNKWINDAKKWYNAYTVKSPDYMEIVADDMIPWFDRGIGRYVPKTEEFFWDVEQSHLNEKRNTETFIEDTSYTANSTYANTNVNESAREMPKINISENDEIEFPF